MDEAAAPVRVCLTSNSPWAKATLACIRLKY